jgi:catechol 2,3-dioxygenase-like lactoylglutathione lyase family enzyme
MSRFVGPTRQIGNIVHDIDEALRYWTETMGAGPFFVNRRIRFDNFRHHGVESPSPLVSLAFGQSGAIQIELIQQHDDVPSGYRNFLDSGREGAQHLAHWFDNSGDYDEAYQRLLEQGLFVRHEGDSSGVRFAYFSKGEGIYPEIELAEGLLPRLNGWFDYIAKASVGWDGSDPVRQPDGTPEPATVS